MATLKERVEDYIGTFSDTGALDAWIGEESKNFIELLPFEKWRYRKDWVSANSDFNTDFAGV